MCYLPFIRHVITPTIKGFNPQTFIISVLEYSLAVYSAQEISGGCIELCTTAVVSGDVSTRREPASKLACVVVGRVWFLTNYWTGASVSQWLLAGGPCLTDLSIR